MERKDELKNKLLEEIPNFRKTVHQFIKKEISVADFKGKSGGMGVYAQKGGEQFMIRLRIPSGVVSSESLKLLGEFTEEYELKYVHLTTRQAIQLHDLKGDTVCDIMEKAAKEGLYTRGGGGNFPRNVTLSPLSGVEKKEAFDVTPFALLTGEYLMKQITEYQLPRKLKIAFSNSEKDTACATVNDLGFMAVNKEGTPYFKVFLAGGLGNNPALSITYDTLIAPEEILFHVEAITRLFMAEGDYQNKGKARLRYIPRRMGEKEFLACYESHLKQVKETKPQLKTMVTDKISQLVLINKEEKAYVGDCQIKTSYNNLVEQKQPGLYAVKIHPLGGILPVKTLLQIIDFLKDCKKADVRLTMFESMYIRNLEYAKAMELLELTKEVRGNKAIEKSISCIGVPTCQIGIEQSQELLRKILEVLKENNMPSDYLPSIHISGCKNSCARHQVTALGFAGCKKRIGEKVEDVFEMFTGGHVGDDKTGLGTSFGFMKKEEIPLFINELAGILNRYQEDFEAFYTHSKEEFEKLSANYLV